MSVILILILASLGLALAFLGGFIWAVQAGQFDDTYTPSMRVLTEEQSLTSSPAPNQNRSTGPRRNGAERTAPQSPAQTL